MRQHLEVPSAAGGGSWIATFFSPRSRDGRYYLASLRLSFLRLLQEARQVEPYCRVGQMGLSVNDAWKELENQGRKYNHGWRSGGGQGSFSLLPRFLLPGLSPTRGAWPGPRKCIRSICEKTRPGPGRGRGRRRKPRQHHRPVTLSSLCGLYVPRHHSFLFVARAFSLSSEKGRGAKVVAQEGKGGKSAGHAEHVHFTWFALRRISPGVTSPRQDLVFFDET